MVGEKLARGMPHLLLSRLELGFTPRAAANSQHLVIKPYLLRSQIQHQPSAAHPRA